MWPNELITELSLWHLIVHNEEGLPRLRICSLIGVRRVLNIDNIK